MFSVDKDRAMVYKKSDYKHFIIDNRRFSIGSEEDLEES